MEGASLKRTTHLLSHNQLRTNKWCIVDLSHTPTGSQSGVGGSTHADVDATAGSARKLWDDRTTGSMPDLLTANKHWIGHMVEVWRWGGLTWGGSSSYGEEWHSNPESWLRLGFRRFSWEGPVSGEEVLTKGRTSWLKWGLVSGEEVLLQVWRPWLRWEGPSSGEEVLFEARRTW